MFGVPGDLSTNQPDFRGRNAGQGGPPETLREKQKAGKKMRQSGKVEIPQTAFIQALKMDS
ncbi:MAG: hypothetical protein Q4G26_16505, partial [Paracoccus sp. (in: a-proteobacteria)]|nr:hypothetical protein [Paracoccus sp. (in: a-proteobacteria)]